MIGSKIGTMSGTATGQMIVTAGILAMYFGMWRYELAGTSSLNHFQWIWQR